MIRAIAFSTSEGSSVWLGCGLEDGSVVVINTDQGEDVAYGKSKHSYPVSAVCFCKKRWLVSGDEQGNVLTIPLANARDLRSTILFKPMGGQRVVSISCSRDLPLGVVCSRGKDEMTVTLLEVESGQCVATLQVRDDPEVAKTAPFKTATAYCCRRKVIVSLGDFSILTAFDVEKLLRNVFPGIALTMGEGPSMVACQTACELFLISKPESRREFDPISAGLPPGLSRPVSGVSKASSMHRSM